jgi:hypothetical protein
MTIRLGGGAERQTDGVELLRRDSWGENGHRGDCEHVGVRPVTRGAPTNGVSHCLARRRGEGALKC